jgi:hypothetical protein
MGYRVVGGWQGRSLRAACCTDFVPRTGFAAVRTEMKHNSFLLSIEMGDVLAAMDVLVVAGDLAGTGIELRRQVRPRTIASYLHHQPARD